MASFNDSWLCVPWKTTHTGTATFTKIHSIVAFGFPLKTFGFGLPALLCAVHVRTPAGDFPFRWFQHVSPQTYLTLRYYKPTSSHSRPATCEPLPETTVHTQETESPPWVHTAAPRGEAQLCWANFTKMSACSKCRGRESLHRVQSALLAFGAELYYGSGHRTGNKSFRYNRKVTQWSQCWDRNLISRKRRAGNEKWLINLTVYLSPSLISLLVILDLRYMLCLEFKILGHYFLSKVNHMHITFALQRGPQAFGATERQRKRHHHTTPSRVHGTSPGAVSMVTVPCGARVQTCFLVSSAGWAGSWATHSFGLNVFL